MISRSLLALLALGLSAAPTFAQSHGPEEAAVRATLQHYLEGHATGDADHFQRAFHPVADLYWISDGSLQTRTSEQYVQGARDRGAGPAEDEAERRRWIEDVDVTGDAAVAKIVLDYPGARITDYMSLLKTDGEWRIVNKIFHVDRP